MNIVMLGHKRIPSREGGVEIVVEELAKRMVMLGNNVTCYNRKGHHVSGAQFDSAEEESYMGIKLETVKTIEKKGLAAMSSSFFAAIKAGRSDADVVHIHAEGPAAMCWIPKLHKKRVIVTIHGLDWARAKWGRFARNYIKHGEKVAVKKADKIIVLSRGVQEYFKKTYNRETVFIPNGINKPEIMPAKIILSKWGLKKDSYVLFLGRLVPEKGLKYLIEAWRTIKTDKKLVIAGGKSDTDTFEKEITELAGDNVVFTGFVQGCAMEELYSNSYLYCLPSDLEGMPLSLLEAMSYGNCCLTSDISECAEVIEDHGITFPKGNVEKLRKTLQYLLDNPQIVQKYKQNAGEFICSKYNWDDVVKKTLEVYNG